jgi:ABC-type uncharacterized transport system substrate-binding protein
MRRREFITILGVAAGWPLTAVGQDRPRPIIGFLSNLSAGALSAPVTAAPGCKASDTRTEKTQPSSFDGRMAIDQLPALAADLVRVGAAVIVSVGGDPPAFAAKAASRTVPLVFMVGRNPVELGLVASLNRPGGNATGINLLIAETETKRIEILRQLVPGSPRFAVLVNPKNADAGVQLSMVQSAAQALNQKIAIINASTEFELDEAFARFQHEAIGAFILVADPFFVNRRDQIVSLSNRQRTPGMYFLQEFAESGGLASYGVSLTDAYRQAGCIPERYSAAPNPMTSRSSSQPSLIW